MPGLEHAVVADRRVGVAGDVEHLRPGPHRVDGAARPRGRSCRASRRRSRAARPAGVAAEQLERRRAVRLPAGRCSRSSRGSPRRAGARRARPRRAGSSRSPCGRREQRRAAARPRRAALTRRAAAGSRNDEPEAGRRLDLDRAAALLDDPVDGREPEPGAAFLRREERIEELLALVVGHADARVRQAQLDERALVGRRRSRSRSSPSRRAASRRARSPRG